MSFQGIEAGKAFVEFLIKDDKLDSGLLKISDKLKKFGTIGLAASSSVLAGFAAAAGIFAKTGGELQDLADRTGLTVESLSFLNFAAEQTGTDLGAIEAAAKNLQKNGIDPLKFDSMLSDLAAIPDKTMRAQRAFELFGKRGIELVPMIEQVGQLRADFSRLDIGLSTEQAAAADRLGDTWGQSKAQFTKLVQEIGAAIAGPLTDFLSWTQGIVRSVIEWVHQNPVLAKTLFFVAVAIGAVSAALIAAGTAVGVVAFAMGALDIALAPILPIVLAVAGILAAITAAAWAVSGGFTQMIAKVKELGSAIVNKALAPLRFLLGMLEDGARFLGFGSQVDYVKGKWADAVGRDDPTAGQPATPTPQVQALQEQIAKEAAAVQLRLPNSMVGLLPQTTVSQQAQSGALREMQPTNDSNRLLLQTIADNTARTVMGIQLLNPRLAYGAF